MHRWEVQAGILFTLGLCYILHQQSRASQVGHKQVIRSSGVQVECAQNSSRR